MNRLVDGAVAEAIDVPEQVNPAIRFPEVSEGSVAVEVVAATPVLVVGVPCETATGAAAPENAIDPPETFAGVPPATVATTLAVPAAVSIAKTCRNPAAMAPECTTPRLVMADPAYVHVQVMPESLLASTAIAASRTTFAPTTVCENVSGDVALVAPEADGPTLSKATATNSPPHRENARSGQFMP
jgi:hypothetical protein